MYGVGNNYISFKEYANDAAQFGKLNNLSDINIKEDITKLGTEAREQISENWFISALRNMGINEPKKFCISIGATIATVIGLAAVANKGVSSDAFVKLGQHADDIIKNSKLCKNIGSFFNSVGSFFKKHFAKDGSLIQRIGDVVKPQNRMQPRFSLAKMSVLGPKGLFSLTPPDILRNIAKKADTDDLTKLLEALIGKSGKIGEKNVSEVVSMLKKGGTLDGHYKVCENIIAAIKKAHPETNTSKGLANFLSELSKGKIGGSEFNIATNVKMGDWFPLCKGNLGDALKKFCMVTGKLSDTALGKLLHKASVIPAESISNCVNDKSFFGILIALGFLPSTFTAIQNAKKGEKVPVAADSVISTVGSWAITMPLAASIVYGIASLSKLPGKSAPTRVLRAIGRFAGAGLNGGKFSKRFGGGLMRFLAINMLGSKFMKPIAKTSEKIFGKVEQPDMQSPQPQEQEPQPDLNSFVTVSKDKITQAFANL